MFTARIVTRWLMTLSLALLVLAPAAAASAAPVSVRSWTATAQNDNFDAARAALAAQPPQAPGDGPPAFRTRALEPQWLQLELPGEPDAGPMVLELTHGALRHVNLFERAPDGSFTSRSSGLHAGLHLPDARFPTTFVLPPSEVARTVWLHLDSVVTTHGEIRWQPESIWQREARLEFLVMGVCFGLALLVVLYALIRAVRLRSSAYAIYAGVGLSLCLTGTLITGYGSAQWWPQGIAWRGQLASGAACISSGLVLLLARRAFTLEVSVPRWSAALLWAGLGSIAAGLLGGLAGSLLSVQAYQALSHLAALTAGVMGLVSIWLAHRTGNPVAIWLLAGFTPVLLAALITTLGMAGVVAFLPWMLLLMPLGGVLELPFNLYGLALLQRRREMVQQSLAGIAGSHGPERESRPVLVRRLTNAATKGQPKAVTGVLTLLRFENLAPGSEPTRGLDPILIEQYFHAVMGQAVRPGNQVGRWSYHELVVYDPEFRSELVMRDFVSALFAQALRCETFGLQPSEIRLRIAYGSLDSPQASLEKGLARLSRALDKPALADTRRITINLTSGAVLWPRPARKSLSRA